jgi:hypothetical protein
MARGNVLSALAAARDLPQLSLVDALELTVLVADPRRHPRVAARWLLRLLEEQPDVTIEEAAVQQSERRSSCPPGSGGVERAEQGRSLPLLLRQQVGEHVLVQP